MKSRYILLVAFFLGINNPAFSQSNFNGAYGSVLFGGVYGNTSEGKGGVTYLQDNTPYTTNGHGGTSLKGWGGALKFGHNKVYGDKLLGLEAGLAIQDFQNTSPISSTYQDSMGDTYTDDFPMSMTTRLKNYQTLSLRAGHIANGKTLLYVSGGAALGNISRQLNDTGEDYWFVPDSAASVRKLKLGYVLGVGLEHIITSKVSVRAHYEYVDFGKISNNYFGMSGEYPFQLNQSAKLNLNSFTIGLTYSF